jgi:hypothetical protein
MTDPIRQLLKKAEISYLWLLAVSINYRQNRPVILAK